MESPRDGASSGPERRSGWNVLFAVALGVVALSIVIFVIAIANAAAGGSNTPPLAVGAPTLPSTASAGTAPAPASPSAHAPTPTIAASPGPDGDNSPVVTCGDLLAPVDKQHRLAADCAPGDLVTLPAAISAEGSQQLRAPVAASIEDMFAAASAAGFQLQVNSGYRSYQTQVDTYNYWVATSGQAYADRTSARAGHSEHQMGTTADVGSNGRYLEDFTGTPEATWLADNCWKYGFIISYPDGKEAITGYAPEPWHIRFVGKDVAAQVHQSGLTLHEFLLQR